TAAKYLNIILKLLMGAMISPLCSLFIPPIQVYGVEGRYAYALFSAKELITVFALVKDPKLSGIMVNPHVKRSIKEHTFTDVMTIIINVLNVMADNDRLTLTSDIISAFSKMMRAHRGEVLCTVTTTQSAKSRDEYSDYELVCTFCYMSECLFCSLSAQSDPSILGGMTISIRDKYVYMSTETKIQKLTKIRPRSDLRIGMACVPNGTLFPM
uniref:Oligomycin sensitivity conferral protein n=1 Tax=Oncorhynchus kisutch TaxID=8019 RepID=A0A8C7HEE5_ONCKI